MAEKHPEIIIIKRRSEHEEEHHGGAWKIAFADFMTAMMAFFLVLWIINAADKNTKTIIARYFNPLKLEDMAKAKKGIRQTAGDNVVEDANAKTDGASQTTAEPPSKTPKEGDNQEPAAKAASEKDKEPVDPAHPKAHFSDTTLFSDPYASLDQIAGKAAPRLSPKADAAAASGAASTAGGNAAAKADAVELRAFVDPFKPPARSVAADAALEAPQQPTQPAAGAQPHAEANANARPPLQSAVKPPDAENATLAASPETVKIQSELAKELRAETHAQPAPGVEVKETPEGTLISLTDEYNFGMFASGSAEPQPKVVRIMEKIAQILKSLPGTIVVRGHTDARPFKPGTYDNWRLSSARAQMAYYMLIRGGLDEKRIERIEGYADRHLKTPGKPEAAENRRIEILLRKEKP